MTAIDIKQILKSRTLKAKCHNCGNEIEMPNMMDAMTRESVLSPFCCACSVFTVQWLTHHGWHVRNLGFHDNHPYFCPDCWKEGTPEYEAKDYGKQWCEQAQEWVNSINNE